MSEVQDSWKEVAGKAEALGLKLKLHLEQEQEEGHDRTPGDTKAMIDDLSKKLSDAFDSFGNAAKDPAVHADVKEVGTLLKDALVTTFTKVGDEVSSRTGAAHSKSRGSDSGSSAADNGEGDADDGRGSA